MWSTLLELGELHTLGVLHANATTNSMIIVLSAREIEVGTPGVKGIFCVVHD